MMQFLLIVLAQASGGDVPAGWVGGGAIGGLSIVTALVMMFKYKEAAQRELIDTHKQRADESEARAKELAETHAALQHADIEVKKMFAESMNAVAAGKKALAEALLSLTRAMEKKT